MTRGQQQRGGHGCAGGSSTSPQQIAAVGSDASLMTRDSRHLTKGVSRGPLSLSGLLAPFKKLLEPPAIEISTYFGEPNQPGRPGPVLSIAMERMANGQQKKQRQTQKTSKPVQGFSSDSVSSHSSMMLPSFFTPRSSNSTATTPSFPSASAAGSAANHPGVVVVTPRAVDRFHLNGAPSKRAALPEPVSALCYANVAGVGRVFVCATRGRVYVVKTDLLDAMIILDTQPLAATPQFRQLSWQLPPSPVPNSFFDVEPPQQSETTHQQQSDEMTPSARYGHYSSVRQTGKKRASLAFDMHMLRGPSSAGPSRSRRSPSASRSRASDAPGTTVTLRDPPCAAQRTTPWRNHGSPSQSPRRRRVLSSQSATQWLVDSLKRASPRRRSVVTVCADKTVGGVMSSQLSASAPGSYAFYEGSLFNDYSTTAGASVIAAGSGVGSEEGGDTPVVPPEDMRWGDSCGGDDVCVGGRGAPDGTSADLSAADGTDRPSDWGESRKAPPDEPICEGESGEMESHQYEDFMTIGRKLRGKISMEAEENPKNQRQQGRTEVDDGRRVEGGQRDASLRASPAADGEGGDNDHWDKEAEENDGDHYNDVRRGTPEVFAVTVQLSFANVARAVIAGCSNGQIYIWEVPSGRLLKVFDFPLNEALELINATDNQSAAYRCAPSSQGSKHQQEEADDHIPAPRGSKVVASCNSGGGQRSFASRLPPCSIYVGALTVTYRDRFNGIPELWVGYGNGTIAVVNLDSRTMTSVVQVPNNLPVSGLEAAPQLGVVVAQGGSSNVSIWRVNDVTCLRVFPAELLTCGIPLSFLKVVETVQHNKKRVTGPKSSTVLFAGCVDGSIVVRRLCWKAKARDQQKQDSILHGATSHAIGWTSDHLDDDPALTSSPASARNLSRAATGSLQSFNSFLSMITVGGDQTGEAVHTSTTRRSRWSDTCPSGAPDGYEIACILLRTIKKEVEPHCPVTAIMVNEEWDAAFIGDASGTVSTLLPIRYLLEAKDPADINEALFRQQQHNKEKHASSSGSMFV